MRQYYDNDKLRMRLKSETPYKNDRKDGVEKYYLGEKLWITTTYKNGKMEGIQTQYYGDGKAIHKEFPYKNDKLEGAIEIYHKNGKLAFTLLNNNLKCANGKSIAVDESKDSILEKLDKDFDKSFNEYINLCEN